MAVDQKDAVRQQSGAAGDAQQFLTFSLGDEAYGVDILKVQEIKGYVPTRRIPNSPPDVIGILNLRGTIVPIVDMRRKFNLRQIEYDQFTCIIVVVVREHIMGMIVDSVSEVMNIPSGDIQPPPDLGIGPTDNNLRGIASVGGSLIILLDIEAVLLGESADMLVAA